MRRGERNRRIKMDRSDKKPKRAGARSTPHKKHKNQAIHVMTSKHLSHSTNVPDIFATEEAWRAAVRSPRLLSTPAFRYVPVRPGLPRVLLYGDSISIGYTPYVQDLLADRAVVQRIPGNGADTAEGFRMLKRVGMVPGRWDVIHFNWGLHDLKYVHRVGGKKILDLARGRQVRSVEDYIDNMRRLTAIMKQTGAVLIFATTTPVPPGAAGRRQGDAHRYNRAVTAMLEKEGVIINDLYAKVFPHLAEYQMPHDVHFSEEGYRFLGRCVAEVIANVLDRRRRFPETRS